MRAIIIGLDNGLVQKRQQAIIWTDDWRHIWIYAWLSLIEFSWRIIVLEMPTINIEKISAKYQFMVTGFLP